MDDRAAAPPDHTPASTGAFVVATCAPAARADNDNGNDNDNDDDDALMAAAAAEDTAAFARLMRRHEGRLYGFLGKMLGPGDDARDVCQDVFIEVWRARRRYRPEGHFVAWLFRIARSRAIDRGRRRRFQQLFLGRANAEATMTATTMTPGAEDVVAWRARLATVQRAIAQLPVEVREVVALRHGAGLEYAEVAAILGVGEAAARQRASRGLARLRALLEEVEG